MSETKLNTPQLVDAWVRMYCSETGPRVQTADAAVYADNGIAQLRKRLPVEGEVQPTQRTADADTYVYQPGMPGSMEEPRPTQRTALEQLRCRVRDAAETIRHLRDNGAQGGRGGGFDELVSELCEIAADEVLATLGPHPQPTQRTAEEWREACEGVAEKLWGAQGEVLCVQIGGVGLSHAYESIECARGNADALEQLHAALCKRLEQKRRREGGE